MPNTDKYDIPYPDSTGGTSLWEHFQALAERVEAMFDRPMCKVYLNDDYTISGDGSYHDIPFVGTETEDDFGMHSNSVNPARITPTRAGWYWFYSSGVWVGETGGSYRRAVFAKNDVNVGPVDQTEITPDFNQGVSFHLGQALYANGSSDYFSVAAAQDKGSGVDIYGDNGATFTTVFGCIWLAY